MIPTYSRRIAPLTELTRRDVGWQGGTLPDKALEAFTSVRDFLASAPSTMHPNLNKPFTLHCDAAQGHGNFKGAIAGILTQRNDKNQEIPVGFHSKVLSAN